MSIIDDVRSQSEVEVVDGVHAVTKPAIKPVGREPYGNDQHDGVHRLREDGGRGWHASDIRALGLRRLCPTTMPTVSSQAPPQP